MTPPVNAQESKTNSVRWETQADLIVVGSGVAGLTAALRAQELGLRTLVVTKAEIDDGNTRWAQGGIAVVLGDEQNDSVARHIEDTVSAGVGLCDEAVVQAIVHGGPPAVAALRTGGAQFDVADNGFLARTREGGHSAFRVIHAGGDATGAEVERALVADAAAHSLPVLERHVVLDTLRTPHGDVVGLIVLDDEGRAGVLRAPAVLLATGGLGQLYQATSNPEVATGDGLALALRAGAQAADLEFIQFHPTVLFQVGARGRRPLVTEAVRGEGAVLVDGAGESVMRGVHPLEDLAPRDVVSAAITRRMSQNPGGIDDHVFLDATGISAFPQRFPTVYAACQAIGIEPIHELIPVSPAAHFACGGIVTDVDGRTNVRGLYAAGEVARTGLHGANRLASNSLLEGLVVGTRAAEAIALDLATDLLANPRHGQLSGTVTVPIAQRDSLQRVMSRYAGVGRDADGLSVVSSVLNLSTKDSPLTTVRAVEDAALTLVAQALVSAASQRSESRGCHIRTDFPERDDSRWRRSQLIRLNPSGQPVLADSVFDGFAFEGAA